LEIFEPHHMPAAFTLWVLVAVIAVKETLFRVVDRIGHRSGSMAMRTDAWHHRTDAITSIAALVGISIALIGGPRWQSADAWAALFACFLIAWNGWRLFYPALHEVLDTAPQGEITEMIRSAALAVPGVLEIEKCRVRKMGLEFYVDLHVGVDEHMSVRAGHELAHRVKDTIRQSDPRIADVLVHIEPAAPGR
jgi:cation diffusion facilitator family transporter